MCLDQIFSRKAEICGTDLLTHQTACGEEDTAHILSIATEYRQEAGCGLKVFQVLHWFVLIFFVGLFGGIYLISFMIDIYIYSNTYRYS